MFVGLVQFVNLVKIRYNDWIQIWTFLHVFWLFVKLAQFVGISALI